MKGSLIWSLAILLVLASGAVAQEEPIMFDEARLLFYSSQLQFSYPLALEKQGAGARAAGMGGAFIGVSDDISAVSWNPAGLYRTDVPYEQPVIGISYKSFSYNPESITRNYGTGQVSSLDDAVSGVEYAAILLPVRPKGHPVVISLAMSRLGDEAYHGGLNVDTSIFMSLEDLLDGILNPWHYRLTSDYRSWLSSINIGFGTRVYKNLRFGLSVNTYTGNSAQVVNEEVIEENIVLENVPGNQRATLTFGRTTTDSVTYGGYFLRAGFMYDRDRFSAGLVITLPHVLKETRDVKIETFNYVNYDTRTLDANVVHIDDNVMELEQPLEIGLGLAYEVNENFLLAADIEYKGYDGKMVNVRDSLRLVPGGTDEEFFTENDPYWNNTLGLRLGGEYNLKTDNKIFPIVPIRAGFSYQQIPSPNVDNLSLRLNDDGSADVLEIETSAAATSSFAFGTGVHWNQIHLDAAYTIFSLKQENLPIATDFETSNSALRVTFTGFF